ncbi:hypothetical protein ACA910_014680 [Epithemia clementina (nom. ined.)]
MSSRNWNCAPGIDLNRHFLCRIGLCTGSAIHGVVFEYNNGDRSGVLLSHCGDSMGLDDNSLNSRAVQWFTIGQEDGEREPRGDYMVRISGHDISSSEEVQEDSEDSEYCCHSLSLEFSSGQIISSVGDNPTWQGRAFSHSFQPRHLVHELVFRSLTLLRVQTKFSVAHLPIDRNSVKHLPRPCRDVITTVLQINAARAALQVNRRRQGVAASMNRENTNNNSDKEEETNTLDDPPPLPEHVWWLIFSYLRGYDIYPKSIEQQRPGKKSAMHYNMNAP